MHLAYQPSWGSRIAQFLHSHLLWFLLLAYLLAAVVPTPGLWVRNMSWGTVSLPHNHINISTLLLLLAVLMFNAGLGVKTAHLHAVVEKKLIMIIALAANVVIPIGYSILMIGVMQYWHNAQETQQLLVGLALVGAMPIAGASTAWAQNSNGNLALSLGLVLISTMLSPVVTPMAFYAFGELASAQYEEVLHYLAEYGSGAFLGLWVVLPSALGLGLGYFWTQDQRVAWMPGIKLANALVLLILNYSNAAVSLPKAVKDPDWDFLIVTLIITGGLCITAFATANVLSRWFQLHDSERVSLLYGLGMNNNGTGLVVASLALPSFPRIMIPIIFYNLIQHIVAGIVHARLGRRKNIVTPV